MSTEQFLLPNNVLIGCVYKLNIARIAKSCTENIKGCRDVKWILLKDVTLTTVTTATVTTVTITTATI